jgi:hypothetical protein
VIAVVPSEQVLVIDRRRLVRTSSTDGWCGSLSAQIRSTVPWPPPASEKPTQLASQ